MFWCSVLLLCSVSGVKNLFLLQSGPSSTWLTLKPNKSEQTRVEKKQYHSWPGVPVHNQCVCVSSQQTPWRRWPSSTITLSDILSGWLETLTSPPPLSQVRLSGTVVDSYWRERYQWRCILSCLLSLFVQMILKLGVKWTHCDWSTTHQRSGNGSPQETENKNMKKRNLGCLILTFYWYLIWQYCPNI